MTDTVSQAAWEHGVLFSWYAKCKASADAGFVLTPYLHD